MFDEKSYSLKMDKAIEVFSKELSSLRTGRANASMLDLVKVDVYGQQMPINQIGSITTPEPRMINIQVWDTNNVPLVDAAIKKSDLAKDASNARSDIFSGGEKLDAKILELDFSKRTIKLSPKEAQIQEEASLIKKFSKNASKSGQTLASIFKKAMEKKEEKK